MVCYNVNDLFLEVRLKRLVLPEVTLVLGTLLQLVQVHTKETLPAHPSFKSIRVKGAPTSQTPVPCYEQVCFVGLACCLWHRCLPAKSCHWCFRFLVCVHPPCR